MQWCMKVNSKTKRSERSGMRVANEARALLLEIRRRKRRRMERGDDEILEGKMKRKKKEKKGHVRGRERVE